MNRTGNIATGPWGTIAVFLVLTAWIFGSIAICLAWSDPESAKDWLFQADIASGYNLANDLRDDWSSILEWNLPPANYLFPEQVLLAPLAQLRLPMDRAAPVYAVFAFGILALGIGLLHTKILGPQPGGFTAVFSITAIAGMASTLAYPAYHLLNPQFHGAPALFFPLIAWLLLAVERDLVPWKRLGCAALIVFLLSFSDRLAFLQIVVPLSILSAYVGWRTPAARKLCTWLCAAILAAGLLGMGLDFIWRPHNPGAAVWPEVRSIWSNSNEIWRLSTSLRRAAPMQVAVALISVFGAFAVVLKHFRYRPDQNVVNPQIIRLAGFSVLYFPMMHMVHAGSSLEPVLHYRLFDLTLALVLFPVLVVYFAKNHQVQMTTGLLLAAAGCWLLVTGSSHPRDTSNASNSISRLVNCVDELNATGQLSYGAAEYWDAIPINALSRSGVTAISVNLDLSPRPWNQKRRIDPTRTFDFLILKEKFEFEIAMKLRAPLRELRCDDRVIWVSAPAR